MVRKLTTAFAAMILVASIGCKKEDKGAAKDADKDKPDPTAAKADPEPPKKEAKQNPAMLNDMKNCPSAVKGATTEVAKSKDGKAITVTVTAGDAATIAEVQKRGAALVKSAATDAKEITHTGTGTGGGLGKCPVVLSGTKVAAANNDKGVVVTVTPDDTSKFDGIHTMSAERAASMNKRGGVAHGTGAGMKSGMGAGGQHNMKHSGKRSGDHGSGTGGGGSVGASKKEGGGTAKANPCGDKKANPCGDKGGGKGANPCGGI